MTHKAALAIMAFSIIAATGALSGCSTTPEAQHEMACVGGTLGGMVLGGAIGNRFGGGSGQAILTGAGAYAGGVTAATQLNC